MFHPYLGKIPSQFWLIFVKEGWWKTTNQQSFGETDWLSKDAFNVTEGNGGFLNWWVSPTTMGFPY